MTNYSIKLPQTNVHAPSFTEYGARFGYPNEKLALASFDVDGQKGFSSDELMKAFDYFVQKEKEVAVDGTKGDGIITSKDIEQIIQTDSRFSAIREKINDNNQLVDLFSQIILTLSTLVSMPEDYKAFDILPPKISVKKGPNSYGINSMYATENIRSDVKEVDGQKVTVCENNKGETYVQTADGKRNTDPAYVAKCLGYKSESTWFGLGNDKYYVIKSEQFSKGSNQYKLYKNWNEETHSYTNGKFEYIGTTHVIASR